MDFEYGTPMKSQATPWNFREPSAFAPAASLNRRRKYERIGAMPVPVANMMMLESGSSGSSISAPVGPVMSTSWPTSMSQMWLEQTPRYTWFSGKAVPALSALSSPFSRFANFPSNSTTRFTQRETVLEVSSSPTADDAIEYSRIFAGVSPFLSGPGAITPMDWPSM